MVAICSKVSTAKNLQNEKFEEPIKNTTCRDKKNLQNAEFKIPEPPKKKKPSKVPKIPQSSPNSDNVFLKPITPLPSPIKELYKETSFYKYKLKTLLLRFPLSSSISIFDIKTKLVQANLVICEYLKKCTKPGDFTAILISAKCLPFGRIWTPFISMKYMKIADVYNNLLSIADRMTDFHGDDVVTVQVYIAFAIPNPKCRTLINDRRLKIISSIIIRDDNLCIPKCLIAMLKYHKSS